MSSKRVAIGAVRVAPKMPETPTGQTGAIDADVRTGLVVRPASSAPSAQASTVVRDAVEHTVWSEQVRSALTCLRLGTPAANGSHVLHVRLDFSEGLDGIYRVAHIVYGNGSTLELTAKNGSPVDARYKKTRWTAPPTGGE